ncbi:MAG: GNAT family N-acetyltransferase [Streptosporangiales bacterium]|nr:GNAT family N-acetyltransferase [Streptosporangiales bacterium]
MTTSYPIRPIVEDEWSGLFSQLGLAFHDTHHRPEDAAVLREVLELHRTLVAFDGTLQVGTAGALTMELTVPGAMAPAAGITIVTVRPTHRRRGLLNALMTRQLDDLHESGEAIAMLWASESAIYRRYGYATAVERAMIDVARHTSGLVADAPDSSHLRLELADPAEARKELAVVYDELRPTRPGYISRNDGGWADTLHDPEHLREGATVTRAVFAYDGDRLLGSALYSVSPSGDGPASVRLRELHADDPAAYAALWRFVSTVDLTGRVTAANVPVDAPLFRLLADPRRANIQRADSLWVRLVRTGEAMAQRRYAAPVDLVLDLVDDRCPWNAGTWRLSGDETGATCERTTDPADVRLDTGTLASAYLGDSTLTAYLTTGRAEELRPGALRRLSTAMSWDPRPWTIHSF